jgi:predicted Rossmann fold flavoprotein
MHIYDTAILGAGASGLFAAGLLPGRTKVIIDGNAKPGLKLLACGGGQCNFTNRSVNGSDYFSQNPRFCLSALAGFTPLDFRNFLNEYKVSYTQRENGKFFARSAADILNALLARLNLASTTFAYKNRIESVVKKEDIFEIRTNKNFYMAKTVICALGGLSRPALGATGAAYKIAYDFGINVTPRRPALTTLVFEDAMRLRFAELAGVSCRAAFKCQKRLFEGEILFTHEGLSGPAVLHASLYGLKGKVVSINFLPGFDVAAFLALNKTSPQKPGALLHNKLPNRLRQILLGASDKQLANLNKKQIREIADNFNNFTFEVKNTGGYDKAEITAGGVDTKEISSKTMETAAVPGLYFTGEALDVSGRLGGYNLHWAWASAFAAAKAINVKGIAN